MMQFSMQFLSWKVKVDDSWYTEVYLVIYTKVRSFFSVVVMLDLYQVRMLILILVG